MIKPKRLKKGSRIAVVSLSWGGLGDVETAHKYDIAKAYIETTFGLEVVAMPHALKGSDFLYHHPELRAKDLMDAFLDSSIDAIFSAIGGDDSIRLLPYIDLDVMRQNPKIFLGYSDSMVTHLMLYKAGVVSFYGPSIMAEFGEYGGMWEYTKKSVIDVLFHDSANHELNHSPLWTKEFVEWKEANRHQRRQAINDPIGHEWLQGSGKISGRLFGGCLDVIPLVNGTNLWPSSEALEGAILFLETSEDCPSPEEVTYVFRNLAAQGILGKVNGILMAKPYQGVHYEAYKEAILKVVRNEEKLYSLPIVYNLNFGHVTPNSILPYGIEVEIDRENHTIRFLESATIE